MGQEPNPEREGESKRGYIQEFGKEALKTPIPFPNRPGSCRMGKSQEGGASPQGFSKEAHHPSEPVEGENRGEKGKAACPPSQAQGSAQGIQGRSEEKGTDEIEQQHGGGRMRRCSVPVNKRRSGRAISFAAWHVSCVHAGWTPGLHCRGGQDRVRVV